MSSQAPSRLSNILRQHPTTMFVVGGLFLHLVRSITVNAAYDAHFAEYDEERQEEAARKLGPSAKETKNAQ